MQQHRDPPYHPGILAQFSDHFSLSTYSHLPHHCNPIAFGLTSKYV